MMQVNMLEAKTNLSKLVGQLETHEQDVIYIARNGEPVVQMELITLPPTAERIGAAKGKLKIPTNFEEWDNEIEEAFEDSL